MFLKYLSQSDSLKGLITDDSLNKVFKILCNRKTSKLVDKIDSLKLTESQVEIEHRASNDEDKDMENEASYILEHQFIDAYVHQTLIHVFSIHSKVAQALDKDQKKKVEALKQRSQDNMSYFTRVYAHISACAREIFTATVRSSKNIQEEAISEHKEEVKNVEKVPENGTSAQIKYKAFQKHLYELVFKQNRFTDYVHVYVASLASEQEHKMTNHLNNLCKDTISLLKVMGEFVSCDTEVHNSEMKIDKQDCKTREELSTDIMKFLIWALSKIAHSFIKFGKEDKKENDTEIHQNLLRSKILSGGIENRFLSCFSQETCRTIENLATITGDKGLVKHLAGITKDDEDNVLEAIIHEGKDPNVDRLLELMQWNLMRKDPMSRAGGKEGMTLCRSAFAAMLALNQYEQSCSYTNFIMMVDHLEMSLDMVDPDANENQKNKELLKELNELENIQPIFDRWKIASKMRIWLQEKRKDISNSIKKKAEAEQKRREEEAEILKETQEKTAHEPEEDSKEPNEETIDTVRDVDMTKQSSVISQEDLLKREKEQIDKLVARVIEKADLLIKLATPSSWDQPDTSNNNLRNIDGYTADKKENGEENLHTKLHRIRSIQASKGTITSFENLSNKDVFNSCSSSVLATLQCAISAKKIMSAIETKYINAMNRYCGLKIMGELSSCYMNDESKISCFNWFCSALRSNTNVLAHYADDLNGMGEYLLDRCRVAFYEVYSGIVKQLKNTTDKSTIEFLLNCTKWRIGATDHQYILKSGIIQTLKDGNGIEDREKNPIKYSWGHKIDFKNYDCEQTLSHIVIESLEFIMMACFSRILGEDEDKGLSMKKTGSSVATIQVAYSVINTNITEVLLATSFEIIFEQLNRYTNLLQQFDPIDWKLFVEERNRKRINGQGLPEENSVVLEDEKTEDEKAKEEEEEQKAISEEEQKIQENDENNGFNAIEAMKTRKTKKEMEKLHSIYDDKILLKLLRLLEVFTAIALKNHQIHQFVLQVTRPVQVMALVRLLLNSQSKLGMITLKIFSNLLKIGMDKEVMNEALAEVKAKGQHNDLFELQTKVKFENSPFLQFLYNLLLKIRSSQWDNKRFESFGSYSISCGIVRILKTILRTEFQPTWRKKIEAVMDDFLQNIDSYPIEEFDILVTLFEGGEYNGMNIGAFGKTQDNSKFITVGFVKKWYDLATPDNQDTDTDFKIEEIEPELSSKDDYVLAIHYDEKHPERNDMFLVIPDEVTLTSTLTDASHTYLLDKDRLNKFIKAMCIDQLPDKEDSVSLTKRCIGMKILVNQIEIHKEKLFDLLEEKFRNNFINFLLSECTKVAEKKERLKCEWYDQRLYALKRYATEGQVGLSLPAEEKSIMFSGKMLSVTTPIKNTQETYTKVFSLASALNYGCVTKKTPFRVVQGDTLKQTSYTNDQIAVLKPSEIDTPEKIKETFRHVDVIVTSDLDLKNLHDQMKKSKMTEEAYFKSITLLGQDDFETLLKVLKEGPEFTPIPTEGLNEHQALIQELQSYLLIEKDKLDEIFKNKEKAPLAEKVKLLVSNANKKKDEKKEEKKEEEKKEEIKEDEAKEAKPEEAKGQTVDEVFAELEACSSVRTNLPNLTEYADNNYNRDDQHKGQKGDLYTKAYKVNTSDVIGEYKNTLNVFYHQLCRKTLSSFFDQLSLESLLDIILTSDDKYDTLMTYVQIRENEAMSYVNSNQLKSDELLLLLKKLIQISANNKKYSKLIEIIYEQVLLVKTAKILMQASKDKLNSVKEVFCDEQAATKGLNIHLIPDALKCLLKESPETVYKSDKFVKLVELLLMIPIVFREDKEMHKNINMAVFKLILPYIQKPNEYNDPEIISGLLNMKFLKEIFAKLPKDVSPNHGNLTNEQKVLFEIYLIVRILDGRTPDISSIYEYPEQILDLEKSKLILKEMKNFDMIAYLVYLEKELTEEERNKKIPVETTHNRYKGKFTAKLDYTGFKKMKIITHEDTKLEENTGIGFSTDAEGRNIIKKITQKEIDEKTTEFERCAANVYMHYPYRPHKVMAFGNGYDSRLGNNDTSSIDTKEPIEMHDLNFPIKVFRCLNAFNFVLGENGKVYWCGYYSPMGGYRNTMQEYEFEMPDTKVVDLKMGVYNVALLTEDSKIYIQGEDYSTHLGKGGSTQKLFYHRERPNEDTEKVTDFDVGYNYHVYTTDNGKCYAAGGDFLTTIGLNPDGEKYIEIKFDEGVVPKRPICTNNGSYRSTLMFVETNGRTELWSGGTSHYGLLGQGDDKNDSRNFAPLAYDKENITFVDAQSKYNHAMALTDKGELYGWGDNGYKRIGLPESKNYYTPTEIPFFKDFIVHNFKVGENHSVVYASPKDQPEVKRLYSVGNNLKGLEDTSGMNNDGIMHLKMFDDVNFRFFEVGTESTYIGFDGEDYGSQGVGVHEGYTCEVTKESPIQGTMHFWKSNDGNWHFVSKEGYRKLEEDICFTTKVPIKDIQSKEWPELDAVDLLEENKEEVSYLAHNMHNDKKIFPIPTADEKTVFEPQSHDVNPVIYYRLARPLKSKKNLPTLNLKDYHEISEEYGLKIEVQPDYSYEKNKSVIKMQKEKYTKTVNSIKKFDEKLDGDLLESIEQYLADNNINLMEDNDASIDAGNLKFNSKELKALKAKDIQPRVNAFMTFNQNFLKIIPYVILDEEMIKEVTEGKIEVQADTLSVLFMISKSLAFRSVKNSYIRKIADSLPTSYEEPEVNLNRMLIMHKKDKGKVDHKGEWTTFGNVMKISKSKKYENLRIANSSYKAWKANFVGEGSIDAGGPFRETVEAIVEELHSSALPLLIPTQNNKNDHGLGRDCWTINPTSTSPTHLEMYKFMGALIGMAFRSGCIMDFKLPSLFWRQFLGEPVTLDDLNYSDAYAVQAIKDLEKNKGKIPKDMFEDTMDMTFTTQLSNGETVPLIRDGASKQISYDEVEEYHRLILKTRAEEGQRQIQAIKEGFEVVFPTNILRILNWRDVEERVRGPSEISVAALKSIVEYSSCGADNEYIKRFWRVFEEFTNEDKSMFLKFVWGRARLPPTERLKDQNFKLYLMDEYRFTDHDIHFPEAHTCFFQLDLPRYSTDEACKSKILYAVQACGEIDTDNSSYSIADAGGEYSDSD